MCVRMQVGVAQLLILDPSCSVWGVVNVFGSVTTLGLNAPSLCVRGRGRVHVYIVWGCEGCGGVGEVGVNL